MENIKTLYGYAKPGDWVIAAEKNYGYLIGKVETIENNVTVFNGKPLVLVDVSAYNYPHSRIVETEEKAFGSDYALAGLKGYCKTKWPADSVISLSFLDNDIEKIRLFGDSYEASKNFCEIFAGSCKVETEKDIKQRQKKVFDKYMVGRKPNQALFMPYDDLTCLLDNILEEILGEDLAGIEMYQETEGRYYAKTRLSEEEGQKICAFMEQSFNDDFAYKITGSYKLTQKFLEMLVSKILPFDTLKESIAKIGGVWYFGQSANE